MSIREKIKAVDNKIEQNKGQYNLDRRIADTFALPLGNVTKSEFFTSKDILSERDWLEKAAALRRFEHSPLGKELKRKTSAAENQYQKFDNAVKPNKKAK